MLHHGQVGTQIAHQHPSTARVRVKRDADPAKLRERDEILTMAEQSAGIGVWDIDLATETVRGTPQFWRLTGLPPTEAPLPLEATRGLRLPKDCQRVAKGFNSIVTNHADCFEMEYRIRRPDGETRWIFGRGRVIRNLAGQPVRYSGIDIDVTERKFAEAALADLKQALENRVRERTASLEAEMARRAEASPARRTAPAALYRGGNARDRAGNPR